MPAMMTVPHIVVVDDDEMLAELMQECLTDKGYAVAHCTRGDEAFAFIRAHQPDVVILDVRMAGIGGLGVLYLLSTDQRTARIPVLLCTAASLGEMQSWDEVLDQKGVPVLYKPFALAELAAAVRALLPHDRAPLAHRP
jgi:two-component system OmpR family response regulator